MSNARLLMVPSPFLVFQDSIEDAENALSFLVISVYDRRQDRVVIERKPL